MVQEYLLLFSVLFVTGANSVQYVESELSQLPKLFHLDDYEKCLADENGVYCLGQFLVYSDSADHPTMELIQKYNQDPDLYNRTYLHRGYCLSERCAGADSNLSARFEQCVDRSTRERHGLRARLMTLHYCQKHGEKPSNAPDTQDLAHRCFLYVIYFLLFVNSIGTTYDLTVEENDQQHPMLSLWSIRRNWRKLTASSEDRHPNVRLAEPLNGMKVLMITGAIYAHVVILAAKMYHHNPSFIEKFLMSPAGPMMGALTVSTQVFVVISNYLLTFNILWLSKQFNIGFHLLPKLFLKRLIRMLPVYLLMNWFASTWWASLGEGPLWPLMVNDESNTCRHKFWATAGFLQNYFDPEKICLVQTWILSVDMQLHLFCLVVTLLLVKYRRHALSILLTCLAGAIGVTLYITYKHSYVPVYTAMTPDNFRELFRYDKSFVEFFITPYNCLIAAVIGMLTGYMNVELQERNIKRKYSWLQITFVPLELYFCYYCYYFKQSVTDPALVTGMITVERVYGVIIAIFLFYTIDAKNPLMDFFRWPALQPFARMTMSVSMVHWCVNASFLASRTLLQQYSVLGLVLDVISTWVISYILAVPLTILVEYPVQNFLGKLITG